MIVDFPHVICCFCSYRSAQFHKSHRHSVKRPFEDSNSQITVGVPSSIHGALLTPVNPPFVCFHECSSRCGLQAYSPQDAATLLEKVFLFHTCTPVLFLDFYIGAGHIWRTNQGHGGLGCFLVKHAAPVTEKTRTSNQLGNQYFLDFQTCCFLGTLHSVIHVQRPHVTEPLLESNGVSVKRRKRNFAITIHHSTSA
ncbi:hypothetical protein H6P81_011301 [Aristolochia fimbriata]|uniref:Uncharacterized protein n=1 Tax=Aristolochia fimbriata TaxID=158543 RepID=A0AAV7EUL5_ARIFI|nr:hypothetical protein H6P81_011301 [Aristolochia fimbriata]